MQSRRYPGIEETIPGINPGTITFGIPGLGNPGLKTLIVTLLYWVTSVQVLDFGVQALSKVLNSKSELKLFLFKRAQVQTIRNIIYSLVLSTVITF